MDVISPMEEVEKIENQLIEQDALPLNQEGDNNYKSPFASLYKAKSCSSQEKRREDLLLSIKHRRSQTVDDKRDLKDLFAIDEEENCERDDVPEPMDVATISHKKKGNRKRLFKYANSLMMSEWFSEVPLDLESNWLVKLCPVGVRNLVIAHNGKTKSFSRKGKLLANHPSHLPGGGPSTPYHKFTVLDCIFASDCYYVLDVLAWNSFSLKDNDTAMRFYWLKTKLDETPELQEQSDANPFVFCEINYFPAELPLIEDTLARSFVIGNKDSPLDGVLFFHKDTMYLQCTTPLVGWLKAYMIPEMLHIPVSECFMEKKPSRYVSLVHYLENKKKE